MRSVSIARHPRRWRPRLRAVLEAGAAVRTLVARLIITLSGAGHGATHRRGP